MDDRQKRVLGSLASMIYQYLGEDPECQMVDSRAMSAGECAISALAEYGYMEIVLEGRIFGRWTDAGRALLEWSYPFLEQQQKIFPEPPIGDSPST